jgi:hypothetical protein
MRVQLTFVVSRASGIEIAVAQDRLKRGCYPFLYRINWLYVIVAVAQDGRLSRSVHPITVDQGMPIRRDNFDILDTGCAEGLRNELSAFLHVPGVLGEGADSRDAQKSIQLLEKSGPILLNKCFHGV